MSTVTTQQKKVPGLRFSGFSSALHKTTLGELSSRIGDGIHTTPSYSDDGEFYFVNGNNLDNGKIVFSDTTKRLDRDEASKHKRDLDTNTLLLSINGTVGNVALYKNESITLGKSACYIKLKESESVDYIYYLIQSGTVQKFYYSEVTGSTIKNLSLKSVTNTPVTLPNVEEQQKIADFLGSVDAWLDNLRSQRTAIETYKRGMMQKLFTQQVRFKHDNGNDFPDWKNELLGNIANITTGSSNREGSTDSGKYRLFDRSNDERWSSDYELDAEALIVAGEGLTFKPRHYSGKFALHQRAYAVINDGSDVNWRYLFYFISFNHHWFRRMAVGTTMPSLRMDAFTKMEIGLPEEPEQQKIADFLTAIDQTITAKAEEITHVEQWKKGLMQKMFV